MKKLLAHFDKDDYLLILAFLMIASGLGMLSIRLSLVVTGMLLLGLIVLPAFIPRK